MKLIYELSLLFSLRVLFATGKLLPNGGYYVFSSYLFAQIFCDFWRLSHYHAGDDHIRGLSVEKTTVKGVTCDEVCLEDNYKCNKRCDADSRGNTRCRKGNIPKMCMDTCCKTKKHEAGKSGKSKTAKDVRFDFNFPSTEIAEYVEVISLLPSTT